MIMFRFKANELNTQSWTYKMIVCFIKFKMLTAQDFQTQHVYKMSNLSAINAQSLGLGLKLHQKRSGNQGSEVR